MILFYFGTDEGRIAQAAAALRERYRAKHGGTNLFVCDADDKEALSASLSALKSRSFFSEPTLITVSGAFDAPEAADALVETLKDAQIGADKELVLLLTAFGADKELTKTHKPLRKLLADQAKTTPFEPLSGRQLTAWMQAFCKERGCVLPAATASALTRTVGNDSRVLFNELSKLCAWQRTGTIPEQAVGSLATPAERDANVFALTDAVSGRAKRAVLRELGHQMRLGSQPQYLLSMYAFAVRNLITVKDLAARGLASGAIAKKAGMHPFVVRKGLEAARNYELDDLERIHAWLTRADRDTKDGTRDATDTLYDFVLSAL